MNDEHKRDLFVTDGSDEVFGSNMDDHGSVLYVIAPDENGPCKIGVTQNVGMRLSAIQIGCWMQLGVFAVRICFKRTGGHLTNLWSSMRFGADHVERQTHDALKDCEVHLRGEWFDVTVEEAVQAIQKAASQSEAAAITLEQLAATEMPEFSTTMEVHTRDSLVTSLLQANSFARKSVDRII